MPRTNASCCFVADCSSKPGHCPRRPPGPGIAWDAIHLDPDGVDPRRRSHDRLQPHPPAGQPDAAPPSRARPVGPGASPDSRQRRVRRQHLQVQDRAVQAVRGVRRVQVRGQVPVRPRGRRVAKSRAPPQVQDGVVPHLPHRGLLPVRAPVPLRAQPGRGGDAEAGAGAATAAGGAQPHVVTGLQPAVQSQPVADVLHGLVLQQRARAQLALDGRPPAGLQQAGGGAQAARLQHKRHGDVVVRRAPLRLIKVSYLY